MTNASKKEKKNEKIFFIQLYETPSAPCWKQLLYKTHKYNNIKNLGKIIYYSNQQLMEQV